MELYYQQASGYHATQLEVPEPVFHWMARHRARKLQLDPAWKIFEYGVGTGLNLAEAPCATREGFDIAAHLAPAVRSRGIRFLAATREAESNGYDAVLSHHCLEHVPEPMMALGEMHRILKPGGTLLLYVPYEREGRYRAFHPLEPNHHLYSWNPQTLGNLVTAAGFVVASASVGEYGYERWAAITAMRLGLGELGYRALIGCLRTIRPVLETRVVAKKAAA